MGTIQHDITDGLIVEQQKTAIINGADIFSEWHRVASKLVPTP